jgi:hypothetical protein
MQGPTTVRAEIAHDVSPPLSVMMKNAPKPPKGEKEAEAWKRLPLPPGMAQQQLTQDPVLQSLAPGQIQSPSTNLNFDGLGESVNSPTQLAPPDTNGAVGATQYVQWVNLFFAIFNKSTGAIVSGPTSGNTLWKGFTGAPQCYSNNNGDPIVLYDKLANRWVFSQFVVVGTYTQCIAVSTTNDATGTYNRYAFTYNYFDDYPKMGVWPDAYYETFNMFQGNSFVGPDACAYDRNAMLAGQSAKQICFQQPSSVGALLPSDVDGTTPPPAGSPNYMLTYGTNSLNLYKFHVDFTTTTNSTFSASPTVIPVASFSPLCGGGTCIPQPGTLQKLDSLADRLMYRNAYRNFGTHESLVVSHSVVAGSSGGIRWYEIQNPNGSPILAQQGTYAPDSNYRWMPSVAMDQAGDLAVGYSISSSSVKPSIAYAGRLPTDPAGTLQTETIVVSGGGSQVGGNPLLTRWGDYSAMTVDPVDDCTFWYTQEYLKTTGAFNWNTRIANFKFSNCGALVTLTPSSLTFGNQVVGTTSSSQTLTLTNNQSTALTNISISPTGDFAETDKCGTSIPANSSCTINVTFTPTTTGTRTGTLTVNDSAGTQTSNLTGTGVTAVTLTPSSANFGSQVLNTTSGPQAFTLTNNQTSSLTGISIGFTGTNPGDFAETDNCGTSIPGNSTCTINVTFTPTGYGTRTGTLSVTDSVGTQTSSLTGVAPPTTQITAPPNGATVSGTVTVTATANDTLGIASINIYIDGALKDSGTSSPLNYSWNTTSYSNGTHKIYSTATDPPGNLGTSSTVTVTVNNGVQQLLKNPGFETGSLQYWTAGGALVPAVTKSQHHTGSYSAVLGSTTAPQQNGDSWIYQVATIPSTAVGASLNYYYLGVCNDIINNDWQEVQVQNSSGAVLAQVQKTCTTSSSWTHVYYNLLPYKGQTIRIYLNAHGNADNNLTYMYVDDVTVSVK